MNTTSSPYLYIAGLAVNAAEEFKRKIKGEITNFKYLDDLIEKLGENWFLLIANSENKYHRDYDSDQLFRSIEMFGKREGDEIDPYDVVTRFFERLTFLRQAKNLDAPSILKAASGLCMKICHACARVQ